MLWDAWFLSFNAVGSNLQRDAQARCHLPFILLAFGCACTLRLPAELDRAADFVSKQLARRERLGEERLGDDAYLVARMEVALLRVRKAAALAGAGVPAGVAAGTTLLDTLKTELSEGRELLERLGGGGAEPAVPAAYHRAASEYYKIRGPAAAFYEAALAYLGVTPLTALSPEERVTMAIDVALAALVGEGVYNFGEVRHRGCRCTRAEGQRCLQGAQ